MRPLELPLIKASSAISWMIWPPVSSVWVPSVVILSVTSGDRVSTNDTTVFVSVDWVSSSSLSSSVFAMRTLYEIGAETPEPVELYDVVA